MDPLDDVIAAIATPIGEGGISVIRISGSGAIEIVSKMFRGKSALTSVATHTAHHGYFIDKAENVIDEVIATVFKGPHSYTAEDVVEISCHGGMFISRKILETILLSGVRLAKPGEFTKRAFLNGRIDLSQAEAVADIIKSRSEISYRASLSQLQGRLSVDIKKLRETMLNICSMLELELDFAEEGLEFAEKDAIGEQMEKLITHMDNLLQTYKYGKLYREGVKVVLTGRPNVGKSSILNMLLNENRSIVTEIPGTTRDTIEENITIDGMLFSLVDTAGLRESSDVIEQEGISRTQKEIDDADVVVFILNAEENQVKDTQLLEEFREKYLEKKEVIIAVNKVDTIAGEIPEISSHFKSYPIVYISAQSGYGIKEFKKILFEHSYHTNSGAQESSVVITSLRQHQCILKAKQNLIDALTDLKQNKSNDLIAISLRSALDDLGEIIGLVSSNDILNNIFSKFCIGK